jgi:sugar/nucleoside kinase (ribokinase family)
MAGSEHAKNADWLVVGSVTVDCIVQGEVARYKSGGVVVYGGLTLARRGQSVAACCRLSARDCDVVAPLAREGVYLHRGDSSETTAFINYIDGDARRQQLVAVAEPIGCELLRAGPKQVKYVLLGPLHPRDIDEDALVYWASKKGVIVCADVQGLARYIDGEWVRPQIAPQMRSILIAAQIVKVAREELTLLLQWAGCDLVQLMRVYQVREVVVTDGSRGGYICTYAGREAAFAAREVLAVADPTGAGDVFFAAYLNERLANKNTIEHAAERAAAQAAAQVAGHFITGDQLKLARPL